MKFENKPNECIAHEDRELWQSRSVAVCGIIAVDFGCSTWILSGIRGKGMPDNVGKRNFVCGYLDYDETTEEAMIRETWEETGLNLIRLGIIPTMWGVSSNPTGRQNVTIRYHGRARVYELPKLSLDNCEPDEVESVSWIKLSTMLDIRPEKWAFNHNVMLKEWKEKFYDR